MSHAERLSPPDPQMLLPPSIINSVSEIIIRSPWGISHILYPANIFKSCHSNYAVRGIMSQVTLLSGRVIAVTCLQEMYPSATTLP